MELVSLLDRMIHCRWILAIAGLVLLVPQAAAIQGDPLQDRRGRDRDVDPATTATIVRSDPNNVIAFLTERGEFGASAGSLRGGGFWRATTDQYLFSAGINVGAVVGGDTLVAIGGPFSELRPGSPVTPGLDVFWEASNPADRAAFPEVCTVDAFRRAVFPSLEPFAGEPFPGFAPQTKCLAVNDLAGDTCSDCAGTRLGMESGQTVFGFSAPAVQDFAFVVYRIFNRSAFVTAENAPAQAPGPFTWTDATVAVAIDPDVGESGDDQAAFLPEIRTMVYWDTDFFEPRFQNPPGFGGVTTLGARLESEVGSGLPGSEIGFVEFTVFTGGPPRRFPSSKEEWYQLMTGDPRSVFIGATLGDIQAMASTSPFDLPPGEFVELYVAFFFADVSGPLPDDLRAEAFKDLTTGEIIPDANDDPAFDNFKNVQRTAQAVFDAGFLLPSMRPARPDLDLIPGDGKVTVAWGGGPVEAVNPFAKVARDPLVRLPSGEPDPAAPGTGVLVEPGDVVFDPARDRGGTTGFVPANELGIVGREATNAAYNPDFVIRDFQAFKVWRSFTGRAEDAELIAIFDVRDGIRTDTWCLEAGVLFDDEGNALGVACRETGELVVGRDTGLDFGAVDRGGAFPVPGSGDGLINGVPAFYSVTSVRVNCGDRMINVADSLTVDLVPPVPCLTAESKIGPMTVAVPRTESSAARGGEVAGVELVDGDGEVIPRSAIEQRDIEVDRDDHLTGAVIPPANSWHEGVTLVRPDLLPPDFRMFVSVDSVTAAPRFASGLTWGEAGIGGVPSPGLAAATTEARTVFVSVRDDAGRVLETPSGPAVAAVPTGPLVFARFPRVMTPGLAIVAPGTDEVALTVDLSVHLPDRARQCSREGVCRVTAADGVTPPAALAGFAAPTAIGPGARMFLEALDAQRTEAGDPPVPVPTTDDGRILWPDPVATVAELAGSATGGIASAGATQLAPLWWPDLPASTEGELVGLFSVAGGLDAFPTGPVPPEGRHPGVLRKTATIARTPDGTFFTRLYLSGHEFSLRLASLPADGEVWRFRMRHGRRGEGRPIVPGSRVRIDLRGLTNDPADADLSRITVVPNPYIAASEVFRDRGLRRILFTNMPPRATLRIYTVSGNLVRIIEHTDGSGTVEWDVRTRFDLLAASGIYYWHVTTPDGRTEMGRLAVVN